MSSSHASTELKESNVNNIATSLAEIKLTDGDENKHEPEPLESYEMVPTPTSTSLSQITPMQPPSVIQSTQILSFKSNGFEMPLDFVLDSTKFDKFQVELKQFKQQEREREKQQQQQQSTDIASNTTVKYESTESTETKNQNQEKIKEKLKLTNKLKKKRQRKIRSEKKALVVASTITPTPTATVSATDNQDKTIINEKLPVLLDYETKRARLDKDPALYKRALSEFQKHCVIQQISACKTIDHKTSTFQMITGLFVSHLRHFQKYLSQQCQDRKSGLWYFSLDLVTQDRSWPYTDITEAPTFITELEWSKWILTEKNKTKLRFMRHQVLPIVKRTNFTRQCVLVCSMPTKHFDFRKCTHMMGVVVYDHELANLL